MLTRAERFDDLVLDSADRVRPVLGQRFAATEFAVEEVPPEDPAPWEAQEPALGRLIGPQGRSPHRIVVYRRPVEARARDERDLGELIHGVVVEQVAALLGVPPSEIDPGGRAS
jgi:predicted Zn-dependent protease with MMP-like domain